MKCRYFREWALYGIKPVPTKLSVRQYWWPSVNSVNDRLWIRDYIDRRAIISAVDGVKSALTPALWPCTFCSDPCGVVRKLLSATVHYPASSQ